LALVHLVQEPKVHSVKVILEATATHTQAHFILEQVVVALANVVEMQVMPVLVMVTVEKACVFLSQALLYFMLVVAVVVVNLLAHILDWVDKAAAAVVARHSHLH
jgi:hypothetical protein